MQTLLQYQDLDLKIKRIESEISSSEARKKATEMQNLLRTLQEKLQSLEQQAASINSKYAKLEAAMEEAVKKVEQLAAKTQKVKSAAAEELSEIAGQMKNALQSYERETNTVLKSAEAVSRDLDVVMKNAKTAKSNLMYYKDQYDKLRASKEGELKELKAKLAEQEKKVDPKLLSKYIAKATGKNTKVVVPLENGRCGGCKMEVAASGLAKLEKEKMMECENCGRIIYLK